MVLAGLEIFSMTYSDSLVGSVVARGTSKIIMTTMRAKMGIRTI